MLNIVWNHKCRKCQGQCYLEKTDDVEYLVCIQCGRYEIVENRQPVKVPVTCEN